MAKNNVPVVCECWTDSRGFWHLGKACREQETAAWQKAVAAYVRTRDQVKYRESIRRMHAKFKVIDGKLTLVEESDDKQE